MLEMDSINGAVSPEINWKNSKHALTFEKYYKKGLESLNPSMKKFYNSLGVSPKVLFIKLNRFDKFSPNKYSLNRRNKSSIQFLTPSKIKQTAKQDLQLMYNVITRKILSSGKLMSNNTSASLISNAATTKYNCEICREQFFGQIDFFLHMFSNHSQMTFHNCTVCDKNSFNLSNLKAHTKKMHPPEKNVKTKVDSNDIQDNNSQNSVSESVTVNMLSKTSAVDKKICRKQLLKPVEFPSDIMCCMCMKLIYEVEPIIQKKIEKNSCRSCPFCGLNFSEFYFEHHIATVHLTCDKKECLSQFIQTGYKLRRFLDVHEKITCLHVNCDHNFFIDLNDSVFHSSVEKLDENLVSSNKNEIHEQNDIAVNNSTSLNQSLNGLINLEDVQHGLQIIPIENSDLNIKSTSKSESDKDEQVIYKSYEENNVSSSDRNFSDITSIQSDFETSIEIQLDSIETALLCTLCKKVFQGEQKLLRHLFNRHRFTHPFTCEVCFLCYENVGDLEEHAQIHGKILVSQPQDYDSNNQISPVFDCVAENIEATSSNCNSTEFQSSESNKELTYEKQNNSPKKCKLKIPCIVEKVEYPLDIHNLYANFRKDDERMELNNSELGLRSNFPEDSKRPLAHIDTFSLEEESFERINHSKKRKLNNNELYVESCKTTFACDKCEKEFNSEKSYNEHMFFVHDDDFDDKFVLDLLKPSSNKERIIESLQDSKHEINKVKTTEKSPKKLVGSYVCHICKKRFLTRAILQKHKRLIHLDVSKNQSPVKEKKEPDTNSEEINSIVCPVCDFPLETSRRLQSHLVLHHRKITENCILCNKLFAFGRGIRHILDSHIISTCKQKEYKLSWDGDPTNDVKEAIEVLGEERLLAICCYDGYSVLNNSKTFQCKLCTSTYSTANSYRNHYVHKHGKLCTICNSDFESSEEFLLHLKKIHISSKHYLWFVNTFISTILQTEKWTEHFSESLINILEKSYSWN